MLYILYKYYLLNKYYLQNKHYILNKYMTFLESCIPVYFFVQSATIGFFLSIFLSDNDDVRPTDFNPPAPIYEDDE